MIHGTIAEATISLERILERYKRNPILLGIILSEAASFHYKIWVEIPNVTKTKKRKRMIHQLVELANVMRQYEELAI